MILIHQLYCQNQPVWRVSCITCTLITDHGLHTRINQRTIYIYICMNNYSLYVIIWAFDFPWKKDAHQCSPFQRFVCKKMIKPSAVFSDDVKPALSQLQFMNIWAISALLRFWYSFWTHSGTLRSFLVFFTLHILCSLWRAASRRRACQQTQTFGNPKYIWELTYINMHL